MALNLNELLVNSAATFPERKAIIYGDERITYRKLEEQVAHFAAILSSKGIQKGDRVALVLGNCPEFVISYYGILRLGAVVVPLNPIYTESELLYILENSQSKMVVADSALEKTLANIQKTLHSLECSIYTHEWAYLQSINIAPQTPLPVNEHDLAVILYTSGTTGKPKGAMLSHKNMLSNAASTREVVNMSEEDIIVAVLPIFHVFCMTICMNTPIAAGATMLIIPKFVPNEVVQAIAKEKATIFTGVPTMYNFLLQLPDEYVQLFSSIRVCFSGGASLPLEVLEKFEAKYNVAIAEGFGLSECAPVTSLNPINGKRKPGSAGIDYPGVTNKVVDVEGNEVPRGEIGELIVKGPNVMLGYLGMPEETAATIKDGWLYTGDLAKMDEEGYIFIVDRKKDMVLTGGYNVYPREVEEVLYEHPDILEAAVIGVPHPEFGESVKAFIVSKSPLLNEEDVIQFCRHKLAKYKVPREIEFLDELPKNTTGKILRRSLRDQQLTALKRV
ncbi:long-chain-fatty-acid--CoA ligase [Lysinibacillus sp. LZ02]|uniref:long-chain-fatty-acid--CoA ligase n=1 Tax=Lysinibacillus sp. LZ02 TaxID=3420668 RepID=UPI003D35C031